MHFPSLFNTGINGPEVGIFFGIGGYCTTEEVNLFFWPISWLID